MDELTEAEKWTKIVGKTIASVDTEHAINVVILRFTDGTAVQLNTDRAVGFGLYCPTIEEHKE
jgi:hypothetical protein